MATLQELANIVRDNATEYGQLEEKVAAAAIIKAQALIVTGTPTADVLRYAEGILDAPNEAAKGITRYIVGANESSSINAILTANDNAIQTNVDAAMDKLSTIPPVVGS